MLGISKLRWRRLQLWVKIAAVVVVIALVSTSAWVFIIEPRMSCGQDVNRVNGECVGVTDGEVALTEDLRDVLSKILVENQRVDRMGSEVVTVAYLLPLPNSPNEGLGEVLRHELQGAYIAQLHANRPGSLGDKPLIKILVANYGNESEQWPRVVSTLLKKVNSERIVAAVVTGQTEAGTLELIDALRFNGLPVIASRLTGDRLTNLAGDAFLSLRGGLARVASTNRDQANAMATYLNLDSGADSALLVQDTDPKDLYLKSLGDSFSRAFHVQKVEPYNRHLGGVANRMVYVLKTICTMKPNVVLFAGRSDALASFVKALPGRDCPELPISVVAGADTVEFANKVSQNSTDLRDDLSATASTVSVKYMTQASPRSWDHPASAASFNRDRTRRFGSCEGCYESVFRGESLEDGAAILGYDAAVVAVTAIRPGVNQGINDQPDLVSQAFNNLHGSYSVAGASGWISLGVPGSIVNKAVAILEVKPDGRVAFLALSSPDGSPCVPKGPGRC